MVWKRHIRQMTAAFLAAAMTLCPMTGRGWCSISAAEMKSIRQIKGVGYTGDNGQALRQAGYNLVWNDEFDGTDLDRTKWDFQLGTKASNEGAPEDWGNNEAEYYTDENYSVGNGVLTITAKNEKKENKQYTSTRIRTMKDDGTCLYATKYGRVEAKMKLPKEEGLWPGFWMLPADTSQYGTWAASGEIDILEAKGRVPDRVNGTIHFGSQWPDNLYLGDEYKFDDSTNISEWHLYSVEWEPGKISWLVDDKVYFTAYASGDRTASPKDKFWGRDEDEQENYAYGAPFDMPFYIILNLAVGGNYDWEANPANATYPASMEVDYVRVWQKSEKVYQALEDAHPKGEKAYKENGGNCIYNGNFTSGEDRLGYWHADNAAAKVKYAKGKYQANVESTGSGLVQFYQGGILLENLKQYQLELKLSSENPFPVRVTVGHSNGFLFTEETITPTKNFDTYTASFVVPRGYMTEDAQFTIESFAGTAFSVQDVKLVCVDYGGTKDAPSGSVLENTGAVAGKDYTIQLAPCNWSVLFLRAIAAGNGEAQVMVNGVVLDADLLKEMADTTASSIRIPALSIGDGDYAIALMLDGWRAVSLTGKVAAPGETASPGETSAPVETAAPGETSAPEETAAPGETSAPEETAVPGETSAPEETAAPGETSAPEETAAPGETSAPEETASPDVTASPSATVTPSKAPAITKKELAAARIALTKPVKASKNSNKIKWGRVNGADGYMIYSASCNAKGKMGSLKKSKTITSGKAGSYTQKGLKSGTWYKYRIDAYRNENGKKVVIAKSLALYSRTTGGSSKVTNPTGVKVSKTKVSLKKGKSIQITTSLVLPKGKKTDYPKITYVADNPDIVKISAKGKITAKKKGKTAVYVYTRNGKNKKILVTVS